MANSLEFELYGDAEAVYYDALIKALADVQRLVRDVDWDVTREATGRRWIVKRLHSSTPTIAIRPAIDGAETLEVLQRGLETVIDPAGRELPSSFSESALQDLRRMGRLFKSKTKLRKLAFNSDGQEIATVTNTIPNKVDFILSRGFSEYGSIEGVLEAINLHGTPRFTIWDRITGAPAHCAFPRSGDWTQKVKSLLQRRVLVAGKIRYLNDGRPYSLSELTELVDKTPDPSLPKGDFGSIPALTGDMDSVEYVRRLRGRSNPSLRKVGVKRQAGSLIRQTLLTQSIRCGASPRPIALRAVGMPLPMSSSKRSFTQPRRTSALLPPGTFGDRGHGR